MVVQPPDAASPSTVAADNPAAEATRDDRSVVGNGPALDTEFKGDSRDSSIHSSGSGDRSVALQEGSARADAVMLPLDAVRPDAWADSHSGSDASDSDSDTADGASLPPSAAAGFGYRYELGTAQQTDGAAALQETREAAGTDEEPVVSSSITSQPENSHEYGGGYSPDLLVRFAAAAEARKQAAAAVTAAAALGSVTNKVSLLVSCRTWLM